MRIGRALIFRRRYSRQKTKGMIEECFAELELQKQHPQPLKVAWGSKFKSEQKLDVSGDCVTDFERKLICGSDSKVDHLC